MSIIHVDMDGVLVDFVRGALEYHNRTDYEVTSWDFDKILFPNVEEFWEPLHFGFWNSLPPMPQFGDMKRLMSKWRLQGHEVYITSSPCDTIGGRDGKYTWVKSYLPEFVNSLILIKNKKLLSNSNSLLIDDADHNVCHWEHAVLVPQPWNAASNLTYTTEYIEEEVNKCLSLMR